MASIPKETRQWILANHPTGVATHSGPDATFAMHTAPLPELKPEEVLIQVLALSNDPAQRGWIDPTIPPDRMYIPPVQKGQTMRALMVGRVLASKSASLKEGQLVSGGGGWAEYIVRPAKEVIPCRPLPNGLTETHYLGAFGLTGLTAYYGLVEVAQATKADSVVVSGAAGATGSMVVQIAKKIVGCKKVIGIAGTEEKCRWVEGLGADVCLNYKNATFEEELKKATDGYVEVYFDNVGGKILDLMLGRVKTHGRIAACGAISGYNHADTQVLENYMHIIVQRLQIRGFIVTDYAAKFPETVAKLVEETAKGNLKVDDSNETVVDTKFEDVPKTWLKLFEGGNMGKLVTKLS